MQRLSHKQLRMIWLTIGVFAALLIAALSARSSALYASTWDASYWNNKELSGDPALVRSEPAIDHDWGAGSPAPGVIGIDNFSARWTRVVDFPTTGVYRFKATTDDGMRMWVDDVLIIDSWYDSVAHTVEADAGPDRDVLAVQPRPGPWRPPRQRQGHGPSRLHR